MGPQKKEAARRLSFDLSVPLPTVLKGVEEDHTARSTGLEIGL